ncbi:MAG TPA: DUF429 domain-containing protein [Methanomicrobia archaeon]|nr:DUF429 domain-containing protein [Methanomicrobia archaeon]HEX58693.1 DUF429 domain-containing protein [Methanomicrobia archaeon]
MLESKPKNLMRVLGVDLAGGERSITGLCLLLVRGGSEELDNECVVEVLKLRSVRTDVEILDFVVTSRPKVVAMDAPLSFRGAPYRDCDVELRKYCRLLPLTFYGMRVLAERGMRLSDAIREKTGAEVIEVYPYASARFLGISDADDLRKFMNFGKESIKNKHEYDAALCGLTAAFYLRGGYKVFGKQDRIIVPSTGFPNEAENWG